MFPLVYHSDQGHKRSFSALLQLSIWDGNIRPSVLLSVLAVIFLEGTLETFSTAFEKLSGMIKVFSAYFFLKATQGFQQTFVHLCHSLIPHIEYFPHTLAHDTRFVRHLPRFRVYRPNASTVFTFRWEFHTEKLAQKQIRPLHKYILSDSITNYTSQPLLREKLQSFSPCCFLSKQVLKYENEVFMSCLWTFFRAFVCMPTLNAPTILTIGYTHDTYVYVPVKKVSL